jgi:hypothetical protein
MEGDGAMVVLYTFSTIFISIFYIYRVKTKTLLDFK